MPETPRKRSQRSQPSAVEQLAAKAVEASQLRSLQSHPDVVALRVERRRRAVTIPIWTGMVLGLAFTAVQVQLFAADGAAAWTLAWCAAWLLDPMVSFVLLGVLWAEQETARYRVPTGPWTRRLKRFALVAIYLMNTWTAWTEFSPSGVLLHSVPPALVFLAAEAGPEVWHRLTDAVNAATTEARQRALVTEAETGVRQLPVTSTERELSSAAPSTDREGERSRRTADRSTDSRADRPVDTATDGSGSAGSSRRRSADEYLAIAADAWTPGDELTARWVQEAAGCSRSTAYELLPALRERLSSTSSTCADSSPDDLETSAGASENVVEFSRTSHA